MQNPSQQSRRVFLKTLSGLALYPAARYTWDVLGSGLPYASVQAKNAESSTRTKRDAGSDRRNFIDGKPAAALADIEAHASAILSLQDQLHACSRLERPSLLAQFFAATSLFPERLRMRHSDIYVFMIKNSVGIIALDPKYPPEMRKYLAKDCESGGPIARLVNHAELFRRKEGLVTPLPLSSLFGIYNNRHGHSTSLESLDDFLKEVAALDTALRKGMVTIGQSLLTQVDTTTGSGRIHFLNTFTRILEISNLVNGTVVDLGGGFGFALCSWQDALTKLGHPFLQTFLFDFGQEEDLGNAPNIWKFKSGEYDGRWTPNEEEKRHVAATITERCFGFDLRRDNLTAKSQIASSPAPYLYILANVTSHYDIETGTSILERINDIGNATCHDPQSFLYMNLGMIYNRSLSNSSMIHVNRGNILGALELSTVRGISEYPLPFPLTKDELLSTIETRRQEILATEKAYDDKKYAMSDSRYNELCTEYGLVTEYQQFSDMPALN